MIGARPGVGKSAFTSQIILEMAKAGKRIDSTIWKCQRNKCMRDYSAIRVESTKRIRKSNPVSQETKRNALKAQTRCWGKWTF